MPASLNCAANLILLGTMNAVAKPIWAWLALGADAPNLVSSVCVGLGVTLFCQAHRTHETTVECPLWMVFLALGALCIPFATLSWLVVAGVAGFLIIKSQPGAQTVGLTIVLLASIRTPLSEAAMALFAEPLLLLDGWAATQMGALLGGGGARSANLILGDGGHAVFVMSGCASLANVSIGLLIWFSISSYLLKRSPSHPVLGAMALAVMLVGVNSIRLGGMTVSPTWYEWLHDGDGVYWVQTALIAIVGAMVLISTRRTST